MHHNKALHKSVDVLLLVFGNFFDFSPYFPRLFGLLTVPNPDYLRNVLQHMLASEPNQQHDPPQCHDLLVQRSALACGTWGRGRGQCVTITLENACDNVAACSQWLCILWRIWSCNL